MKWANLFSKIILTRGKHYYNNGSIRNFHKDGNRYIASVKGSMTYRVSITIENESIIEMDCSCPYANEGHYCKHMAAVLYKIEEQESQVWDQGSLFSAKTPGITDNTGTDCATVSIPDETSADMDGCSPNTFNSDTESVLNADYHADPQPYCFFNCNAMKHSFSWSLSTWKHACQIAAAGQVILDSVDVGFSRSVYTYYSDDEYMLGTAIGRFIAGNRAYQITINFDRSRILNASCGVRGCSHRYQASSYYGSGELCLHQLALLSLLEQYLKIHPLGDATDWPGSQFLNHFQMRKANHVMAQTFSPSQPLLTLNPRIHIEWKQWSVSFRIGPEKGKKTYVVKDLTDLVSQVKNKENVSFGSSTEWNLSIDHFTEQGQRYLEFIQNVIDEESLREGHFRHNDYYLHTSNDSITSSIPLYGRRIDELYEVMGSESAELINGYGKDKKSVSITFREAVPKIRLQIQPALDEDGTFHGISVSGKLPQLSYGQKAAYYIKDRYINRVDMAYITELDPLFLQEKQGQIQFHIGRKHLPEFYYTVLPWLKSHISVVEKGSEEIRKYLPPEVHFIFYLDAEGKNVTCQADAVYGETHVSVTDILSLNALDNEERPSSELAEYEPESFREIDREGEIAYRVMQFLPYPDLENHTFHCGESEDLIYQFLEQGIERLTELGEVQVTDRFRRLTLHSAPKVSVGVSIESQLMNLTISSDQIPPQELLAILGSYRKRRKFHRLKNGSFLKLEDDTFETLSQIADTFHLTQKDLAKGTIQFPAYRALYLDKMLEEHNNLQINRDRHFKALAEEFKTISESEFQVPASLQNTLRNYQTVGYRWLRTLAVHGFCGILADDMGLGKTLQIITFLLSVKEDAGEHTDAQNPAIVITPASLTYNWLEEFHRFAPDLRVCLIAGPPQERIQNLQNFHSWDVFITSYDLLKRDIAEYETLSFSYEILDEAQYIKNHSAAVSKAVRVIKSRIRFALTGTPIENRLSELWSIFDYLMPGFLYSYEGFKRELELPIVKNKDSAASAQLKRMVSPFILRRLKEDVLKDLPDKLEETRFVRLSDTQQRLYDSQVLHMKTMLDKEDDAYFQKNKLQVLSELTRIRQICCDPSLCFENYHEESAKRKACLDLIQSAIEGEHKVLVFSQFASMLELLEQDLTQAGIPYFKITGSTPKEQRLQMVKSFNKDTTPVFLISLKAGGTGLNLTGADVVIHYDPWWNLAVQNQATDRAHRIGQTKIVTVYKLIVKDSIEEKILQLQTAKKNLADEVLNGENGSISQLSKEELLELLKI